MASPHQPSHRSCCCRRCMLAVVACTHPTTCLPAMMRTPVAPQAKPPAASSSAAPAPATALSSLPTKDAIDVASAKAREWAHAVLVGSCVATKHLERQLAQWRAEYSAFASRSGAGGKA